MLRIPISVALGTLFTMSVFWLLWTLVGRTVDVATLREATRIDFSRMRRDTDVQTKRDQKVERGTEGRNGLAHASFLCPRFFAPGRVEHML